MSGVFLTGILPLEAKFKTAASDLKAAFHDHAGQLGGELVPLVQAKTPVRTGALVSSMTYFELSGNEILEVYASTGPQMGAWSRVYVYYQEGEPLGLHTYTNGPRQMFQQTADGDGLAATEAWGMQVVAETMALSIF